MKTININSYNKEIGELVWIPANTPLMYYLPEEEDEFSWRSVDKKEPTYGLVLSSDDSVVRVLVGKEEFYVQKKLVYGVENDY
jgi:hypothetical protein